MHQELVSARSSGKKLVVQSRVQKTLSSLGQLGSIQDLTRSEQSIEIASMAARNFMALTSMEQVP